MDLPAENTPRVTWSRKKKDAAPRGVFKHPSGAWAIRYTCGAGCLHKERVGPLKSDAVRIYHERRARVNAEPGWCPAIERHRARAAAQAAEARRMTFRQYAEQDYSPWAKLHHRGWRTEASRIAVMDDAFGDNMLDALTVADVEWFLDELLTDRSQSTRNRYRTLLHAMLNRAARHGRLTVNPVKAVGKSREPDGRTLYLTADDEAAVLDAMAPEAMHTGRVTQDERRTGPAAPVHRERTYWPSVVRAAGAAVGGRGFPDEEDHRSTFQVRLLAAGAHEFTCALGPHGSCQPAHAPWRP